MTSFTENLKARTYIAGEDLTEAGLRFVGRSGAAVVIPGAGEDVAGVVLEGGDTGQAVSVAYDGVLQVIAGDAIQAGDAIATDEDGAAVPAEAGDTVVGYARRDASEGAIATIDFFLGGNVVPEAQPE